VKRRIVNVANGVANNDAATVGQVKALIAAASSRSTASRKARPGDELRREVAELRLLVQQQQAQIAALLGQKEVAALAD
jgi:hypothetical protein